MSQKTLDIVKGIAQAAADCYDGALDPEGKPYAIGLKREEGHPVYDSRHMDGFKVKIAADILTINYQTECTLKEVYSTPFENDIDATLEDIKKHLQKKYKAITGDTLSLKAEGECSVLVQELSRVRCFALAQKNYHIGGLEGIASNDGLKNRATVLKNAERGDIEKSFKDFLDLKTDKRPKNDTRRA
jgi:hypothetical protein